MPNLVVGPESGLPRLPRGHISFNRDDLGHDVATFAHEYLAHKGAITRDPGLLERRKLSLVTAEAQPEIDHLLLRNGGTLDERAVIRAIDKAEFRMAWKKTNRRAWWVSGGCFFGALLGFAAAGYGQGLGFKALFSPAVAEGIQAGWNPIWYTITGAVSGALTGLFIDKLTSPARAGISRFSYKGAPVQPQDIRPLTREFIDVGQAEGNADGRFNGGRWQLTIFEILTGQAFAVAGEYMRSARQSKDAKEKQQIIEDGAAFVSGRLINDELYWFAIDPSNVEIFDNLRLTFGTHFMRSSPEEIAAFRKAVIDLVRRDRKNVDAEGRAKTDEAIKNYYEPFLDRIINPPKTDHVPLLIDAPVAHAG